MEPSITANSDRKWMSALSPVLALALSLVLTGLALRIYEYVLVTSAFVLPDSAVSLYATGSGFDLLFYGLISLVLGLIYLGLSRLNVRFAFWTVSLIVWLIVALSVALIQYYANVLTPLGSDFFAYNWIEVSDTLQTSVEMTLSRLLPFILFPLLFSLLFLTLEKRQWGERTTIGGVVVLALLTLAYGLFYPADADYDREIDYTLTVNKAGFFLGHALNHFTGSDEDLTYNGPEYPLLREVATENVLGPHLIPGERLPNIVFIILESFGGTLMPPNASYGGFTPFLDSLATESLYWTNFLATSGRSFNAQPSIFGSLPYGDQGFMEMGFMAPEHHSLISILNDNGYHTAYFAGYETRFDKLDQFLERQQIDLLMDASRFPDSYSKMDEIEGGFTWGYSDKDTYRRAFDFIGEMDSQTPRLDIFFSLNFHEPFIIPESDFYRNRFYERLDELNLSDSRRSEFLQYESIFSALLYTDDAVKELMNRYRAREDFENTLFVITGDHRIGPIPHRNRIDRYYVPFMIYSEMLREPARFDGLSSHLDVTPTLLSHLENDYNIVSPDSVHWLGQALNTGEEFSDGRQIPLMRTKIEMPDYLSGTHFLSGDQLFEVEPGMLLRPVQDPDLFRQIETEFRDFKSLNQYVTRENKVMRITPDMAQERDQLLEEESYFRVNQLEAMNPEELYNYARELAFTDQYDDAQTILRRVLRERPNYHDARLLFGRTFGWDGDYERAGAQFEEVMRRNPDLPDVYSASADLYFWQDMPDSSLVAARTGLEIDPDFVPLLFRSARAHWQMNNMSEARRVLNEALQLEPDNEELLQLQARLN